MTDTPSPANDEFDWSLAEKEGDLWLITPDAMTNLGPKEAAYARMADKLAAVDFGVGAGLTVIVQDWRRRYER